jgi:SulP family sulfate permease
LHAVQPVQRHVRLFANAINCVDATGVEAFRRIAAMLRLLGIVLHISGMKLPADIDWAAI